MTLLNDFLVKSNILTDIAVAGGETIKWFEGLTFSILFQNILLPLFALVIICFFLKSRYRGQVKVDTFP